MSTKYRIEVEMRSKVHFLVRSKVPKPICFGHPTVLVVVVSYYFLEKPILEYKKRFTQTAANAAGEKTSSVLGPAVLS